MPFQERQGLRYYSFNSLSHFRIKQGIFTRVGGVSPAPWHSLNLGNTVGDDRKHTQENKERIFQALELPPERVYEVWQVHGKSVVRVEKPRSTGEEIIKADGMITDQPGIALIMRFADCVPLLYFDPRRSAVGIAHAGWKGTVQKIAGEVVRSMAAVFGSRPQDIQVGIGPSIGPDHYQVGEDVITRVKKAFPGRFSSLMQSDQDGVKLDLWKANQIILEDEGVRQVETARICTACHTEDWFSYRAEQGETGRFAALIALLA